jgi:hypothetical protein
MKGREWNHPSMATVVAVLCSVLFTLVVGFGVWYFVQHLRARGRMAIEARFAATDVIRQETLAQSYGQQSRGPAQARGSGALALTKNELMFLLYVPERELRIPIASIGAVSLVRSHLGKSGGVKILHVAFTRDGMEDAIAWRVPDPAAWKAALDTLRG